MEKLTDKSYWYEVWIRIRTDWHNYSGGIAVVCALTAVLSLSGRGVCPLTNLFGLPCPGCGMTRSLFLLMTGHLKESFQMHPFAGLWLLFLAGAGWERYLLGRNGRWKQLVLVLLLVSMLLVYLYRMVMFFPDTEPYIYLEGNLMERMLPGYGELVKYFVDG